MLRKDSLLNLLQNPAKVPSACRCHHVLIPSL
jgi:hypothetical protein